MFSKFTLHIIAPGTNLFLYWYSRVSVTPRQCVIRSKHWCQYDVNNGMMSIPMSGGLEIPFAVESASVLCPTNQAIPETLPSYPHPNSRLVITGSCVESMHQESFNYLQLPRKWDTHRFTNRNGESDWKADFCIFLAVHIRGKCVFFCTPQCKATQLTATTSHVKCCLLLLHNECWIFNYRLLMLIIAHHCNVSYICAWQIMQFLNLLAHPPKTYQKRITAATSSDTLISDNTNFPAVE